jgi:hypothetical protein
MKRISHGSLFAVMLCAVLAACTTTNPRVTTTSDTYKAMARSQQAWCSQFGCDCSIDGQKATCALVTTCVNTGSCKPAS